MKLLIGDSLSFVAVSQIELEQFNESGEHASEANGASGEVHGEDPLGEFEFTGGDEEVADDLGDV